MNDNKFNIITIIFSNVTNLFKVSYFISILNKPLSKIIKYE